MFYCSSLANGVKAPTESMNFNFLIIRAVMKIISIKKLFQACKKQKQKNYNFLFFFVCVVYILLQELP
jgi:hypothetical protein